MRPDRIVMAPPAFDDDLSFSEGVEDLAIEQLIAKAGVEALDVAGPPLPEDCDAQREKKAPGVPGFQYRDPRKTLVTFLSTERRNLRYAENLRPRSAWCSPLRNPTQF